VDSDRPTLGELLADSGALFRDGAAQSAVVLAAGLVPGAALAAAAFVFTGVTSREALEETIRDGRWLDAAPLFAAGIAKSLLAALAFAALVLSVEGRESGRPLTAREAYEGAARRFLPLVAAGGRAVLRIAGGLLLLVVPGLLLALRYSFFHLAVLVDGLDGREALERSAALVSSEPRRALAFLACATLAAAALNALCALVVATATGGASALGAGSVGVLQGQLEALLSELLQGLVGAWLVGFSVLLYRDLASRA
jgi:hypothetical protein